MKQVFLDEILRTIDGNQPFQNPLIQQTDIQLLNSELNSPNSIKSTVNKIVTCFSEKPTTENGNFLLQLIIDLKKLNKFAIQNFSDALSRSVIAVAANCNNIPTVKGLLQENALLVVNTSLLKDLRPEQQELCREIFCSLAVAIKNQNLMEPDTHDISNSLTFAFRDWMDNTNETIFLERLSVYLQELKCVDVRPVDFPHITRKAIGSFKASIAERTIPFCKVSEEINYILPRKFLFDESRISIQQVYDTINFLNNVSTNDISIKTRRTAIMLDSVISRASNHFAEEIIKHEWFNEEINKKSLSDQTKEILQSLNLCTALTSLLDEESDRNQFDLVGQELISDLNIFQL